MAKKTKKKVTRSKSRISGKQLIREIKLNSADTKYFGTEPDYAEIQPTEENRKLDLCHAFNWYTKLFGNKEAKEFLVAYLETNDNNKTAKLVKKVPDGYIKATYGWLARLALRGLTLQEEEHFRLKAEIDRLTGFATIAESKDTEEKSKEAGRPNIQEIMRERASEAGAEIEGMFDDFYNAGFPKDFNTKDVVLTQLQEKKVLPQHANALIKSWEKLRAEYIELQAGKCDQLKEGYDYLSRTQLKNAIKFVESVISDLHGYVSLKQANKKPRVRKAPPVEKVVAKLKYCKEYKQDGLDLVSVSPTKLHNCSEAWVYDTKKRKMHHYVADEYSKVLMVKGTTLIGFDKTESGMKTLRKPVDQIKEITGSKPAARKYFKNIKSVQAIPTGRFNENMVILKAF